MRERERLQCLHERERLQEREREITKVRERERLQK